MWIFRRWAERAASVCFSPKSCRLECATAHALRRNSLATGLGLERRVGPRLLEQYSCRASHPMLCKGPRVCGEGISLLAWLGGLCAACGLAS